MTERGTRFVSQEEKQEDGHRKHQREARVYKRESEPARCGLSRSSSKSSGGPARTTRKEERKKKVSK